LIRWRLKLIVRVNITEIEKKQNGTSRLRWEEFEEKRYTNYPHA